jgi:hypothetical protein
MWLVLKGIPKDRRDGLFLTHMTATDSRKINVFELIPMFGYDQKQDETPGSTWGTLPKAPRDHDKALVESILGYGRTKALSSTSRMAIHRTVL